MKFSCERCGKKYATAERPAPGKVYKLKCKACGHLIVVRAPASAASGPPPPVPAPASTPPALPSSPQAAGSPPPSAAPRAEAPVPAVSEAPPPANGASHGVPELPSDAAAARVEIDATPPPAPADDIIEPLAPPPAAPPDEKLRPAPTPAPSQASGEELRPPPGDGGYIDLFSDLTPDAKDLAPSAHDDPFLRAAPGSLGTAGSAPDPFAAPQEPVAEARPALVPKIPEIPRPPSRRSGLPIALIAAGVAFLVGILAFVLLGSAKKAPPATAPPPLQAVQAPPPAPPPLAAPPPAEPPKAEVPAPAPPPVEAQPGTEPPKPPEQGSGDDRRRRDERSRAERERAQAARDRERRAREERDASARERARRDAAERDRRERERLAAAAARQEGDGTLTAAQIESVIRSTKKAFDSCLQNARGADSTLDGRRVMLRLNIQPSGTVTYPTLDDVTLNATDVGSCLKSAARLMVFPKFKGETMHVEVPLVVR